MRKLLLSFILTCSIGCVFAQGTLIASFDALPLSKPDTFYVTYSNPGQDVGFNDGPAHFQCIYDTAFGGNWTSGFAYSNMTDSITSGYLNQYSAKTAKGYQNTSQYAVFWQGYSSNNKMVLLPSFAGAHLGLNKFGFYITNSTFAYNSMRDGDFISKKFGGVSGNDTDWFKLTVRGFINGQQKADSAEFYLADFRFSNNSLDYIVNDWQFVDLSPLIDDTSGVDSLSFSLSSTDNDPQFGMNTPAYFCMDNFTMLFESSVSSASAPLIAKVYPNPATDRLFVELKDKSIKTATVFNLNGQSVAQYSITSEKLEINTANLSAGSYMLVLKGDGQQATVRFVKQ